MPDTVEATREKSFPREAYRTMEEKEVHSCLNDSLSCAMAGDGRVRGRKDAFITCSRDGNGWEAKCLSSDVRLKS